ncbi:amidohydrolase [Microbacterium resistens]|uniref:amidohydrolase n=1 Tax=Microbacterium resistens TaxID=156977 RepID=UPI001C56AA87|nr:amidohydrolase [Microbacterium resistens]MBW1641080.1 amidohydrolase [Microbacterium resistens]
MRLTPRSRATAGAAAVLVAAGLLAGCTAAQEGPSMDRADTVLRGGFIWTVDADDSVQEAIAIRDGLIVYVGDDEGAEPYIGEGTEVVELDGRMVMPGIQDGHTHSIGGGGNLAGCSLTYDPLTVAEFQARIQECLDDMADEPSDVALSVRGWYRQAMQPAGTDADRGVLDALGADRPIIVNSTDGHSAVVNSVALAAAGITAATPDQDGGHIARDAAGEPTGILEDGAIDAVRTLLPAPTEEDTRASAAAALEAFAAQGVVAFMDQIAGAGTAQAYASLHEDGELTARVHLSPDVDMAAAATDPEAAVADVVDYRDTWTRAEEGAAPGISVTSVGEIFIDGVTQAPAQTASMLAPYLVQGPDGAWAPGTSAGPEPYYTADQFAAVAGALLKEGIAAQPHAIGDRGVREILDAYEAVRADVDSDLPLLIGHAENVDPADWPRFAELNVQPVMGLQWAKPSFDSIEGTKDQLGPERFARSEPIGSLTDAGAAVALGSDWPVDRLDEWLAMQVAVTRENPDGGEAYAGRLGEERGLTVAEAIRVLTLNGAAAMLADDVTGSLETGKYADLIVIDQNITEIDPSRIVDTEVLLTMVGGRVVHGGI